MSVAELVPSWKAMPDPDGEIIRVNSIRGRTYQLRSSKAFGIDLTSIMLARGIEGDHNIFLNPSLRRDMPDPSILIGMDNAAAVMAHAVMAHRRILVFGDYDVDGASSVSVIIRWARDIGQEIDFYIPDRIIEGYGPSTRALQASKANDYDLVIFVDCGTASNELIDDLLPTVIIIDHHRPQGVLPRVSALVNPHREDCTSGLGMLCAASLCFLFVTATQRVLRNKGFFSRNPEPKLSYLLDIVALATVSDVVPLVGPSRLFVSKGIEIMQSHPSPGVSALISVASVNQISSNRIGFALGPRINAGGRIGAGSGMEDGALGVSLLTARDISSAMPIASRLNSMNGERQSVEKTALEQAFERAEVQVAAGARIVTVFDKSWHPGIVGIVAGRIKERFNLPAIVGSTLDGIIKASGRSIPGFDLGGIVIDALKRGLIVSGGGHSMACGIGCKIEEWESFVIFLNNKATWIEQPFVVDCKIDISALDFETVSALSKLEPLGQGMPAVSAFIENFRIREVRKFSNGHIKLISYQPGVEAVWWRAEEGGVDHKLMALSGKTVSLIGTPEVKCWNNRKSIQIVIQDLVT